MRLREPRAIGIETINACNARCPFCPLFQGDSPMDRGQRPAQGMDQALFEHIVAQIKAARWMPPVRRHPCGARPRARPASA